MPEAAAALAGARRAPFWLDQPGRPELREPLVGSVRTDLAVVGGGFTGLWTALLAKEADPGRNVLVLEARECGWAASGRNGGFCSASLTHGFGNGMARWAAEMPQLLRMGRENLDDIEATLKRHTIDCSFERTGELTVALEPWQLAEMSDEVDAARALGEDRVLFDRDQVRAEVDSPTYVGGMWSRRDVAMVDPGRLVWGLRRAVEQLGVRVLERTPVLGAPRREGERVVLRTPSGTVRARDVALATNAFPSPLRRVRPLLVPVWDYVLVTEPLTTAQRDAIGWRHRQGIGDAANQFHYYRLTDDGRVLWGGYDAIYGYGSRVGEDMAQRPSTFAALARHFFRTFPQLEGLRFTHAWGGAIDTCTRFTAFFGTSHAGRVAYAAGYTGLGVGASRFGARVMLDLLEGSPTERTELAMARERPLPFPPEPLRAPAINLTRASLARADRREGRRDPWLRTLDALGLGFDS